MKKNVDSFGTFLETMRAHRLRRAGGTSALGDAAGAHGGGAAAYGGSAGADPGQDELIQGQNWLLQLLAAGDDSVDNLMKRADLDLFTFTNAVSRLTDNGLAELHGQGADQQIGLTESGRESAARKYAKG